MYAASLSTFALCTILIFPQRLIYLLSVFGVITLLFMDLACTQTCYSARLVRTLEGRVQCSAAEQERLAKWWGKIVSPLPNHYYLSREKERERQRKRKERGAQSAVLLQQETGAMTNMTWCGKQATYSTMTRLMDSVRGCNQQPCVSPLGLT